ncbi:MAG: HAMP domain-containing protein [Burkholderiales bacterium]|nr:HAMP domain-containing protein [Burkholderiales bacterium]
MKLNSVRIGVRLGGGFAVILVLLACMMAIGLWRLDRTAAATREMMAMPLAKERLTEEWVRAVEVGVTRAKAIVKSTDLSLHDLFAEESRLATLRGAEITKQIQAFPRSDEEEKLLAAVMTARKAWFASIANMTKAKEANDPVERNRIYETQFLPATPVYLAAMKAYLAHQHRAIDQTAAVIDGASASGRLQLAGLGALALLTGALVAWLLTRSITRPLASAVRVVDTVANGDLSQRIKTDGRDEIAQLMGAFARMNHGLHQMVAQVRQSADSIQTASSEVASGNQDLSHRTEQTAASLQETAASMEELTGTVKQSAESARQARQLAIAAADGATRGGGVVIEMVSTMDEINTSSKKIADIIGVIDGIAFQTNILALNAAVEAARAGEQGRGFAVVASEVRNLAQRSAQAAKEIKSLIGTSVDKVENGSRLVADAGSQMKDIIESVRRVSDIISEITVAAGEQASGIGQVNTSIAQLDQMTQQNSALVEQSAAAAESLRDQALHLTQGVARFTLAADVA